MEKSHRRHGQELEDAILKAAWQVMQKIGYAKMTMDDIARAAHTNKNTIYRRWENKFELLKDVTLEYRPFKEFFSELKQPDNGNLRGDLIGLMCEPFPLIKIIGAVNLKAMIHDYFPEASQNSAFILHDTFIQKYLNNILLQAFKRGEIKKDPKKIDETIKSLPALLMISRIISEQKYDRQFVTFLVDQIILPILKNL